MTQCPGYVQFYSPPGNVHLLSHLLVGKVIRNPKFYSHLAALGKAFQTFQECISERFGAFPVGITRVIQACENLVMFGIPILNPLVLDIPDNHITNRFKEIMTERLNLQTFMPDPERLKNILHHLLAFFAYRDSLACITVQLCRIPAINSLKRTLVPVPEQGNKVCVTMVAIRMQETTRTSESEPPGARIALCTRWAMRWKSTIHLHSVAKIGPIKALRGAFAAMKVLKLFIVDYSRQTLFSNFCSFTGRWNQ